MNSEELRNSIKENKALTIGKETTVKLLKKGGLAKVFLASNCPDDLTRDVEHYARISGIEAGKIELNSEELGVLCKKPFLISIVGVKK